MSEEGTDLKPALAQISALVERALRENRPDLVSNEDLAALLRDALRLYTFKSDKAGTYLPPYPSGAVTATETVVAATGIIRAADMNLWDLAMWFNRASSPMMDNPGGRDG